MNDNKTIRIEMTYKQFREICVAMCSDDPQQMDYALTQLREIFADKLQHLMAHEEYLKERFN